MASPPPPPRCEPAPATRPACTTDADCNQGSVCHVDGTCIEPGKCDRVGTTTYAAVGDIRAMTVTRDSVFLLDYGSDDALGNHRSDGVIRRVMLADASVQTVVGSLYKPLDMKVDSNRVYWRRGLSGEIGLGWVDRDGSNQGDLPIDSSYVDFEWLLGPTDIYAVITKSIDRDDFFRIAKGTATLEKLNNEAGLRSSYGMGIDSEYVYFESGRRWSLADNVLLDPTATSMFVTDPSFIDREHIYIVWGGGATWSVGYIEKVNNRRVTLAEFPREDGTTMYWVKAYRDHVYFAYARPLDVASKQMDSVVLRAPIVAGDTENIALLGDSTQFVEVSDLGLFSIQHHRLVRQVIEDYASDPSPAQGATGAPCFGDDACNPGLSCVDALCQ